MHFHLPKPLHGWRAFAGEVGVIVLGVLIALGAEQAVQDLHWRGEARDFLAAVNSEVEFNLAAYDYRVHQSQCVQRRLAELQRWSAEQREGKAIPLLREIGYPLRVSPGDAIWSSRSADLSAHVPAQLRLTYSDLYATMTNVWEQEQSERDTWLTLNGFNHATKLNPDELIRLDELIYRAKALDRLVRTDARWIGPDRAALGLRASFGDRGSSAPPFDPEFCKPLLPESGKAS